MSNPIIRNIPNAITCCNLISGCIATGYAFAFDARMALVWIITGAAFDFFDGMSARILHVSSPIGKELDSLADDITFGFAPSAIVFSQLCVMDYPPFLEPARAVLPFMAFIMAAFSALRLAKFNLDERQTTSFIGMPTPANALFWGSLIATQSRWLESSPRGHNTWSQSDTYHAVSENPWGPFRVTATLGKGHNPETYRAKDGRYVCYVIDARYISEAIDGPWEKSAFEFDRRDRKILSGLSNITFAMRQDGSMLAVDRGGSVWVSRDGISAYRQIADHSVYSGNKRYFEDPVIWRDSLQYHMIVNDWNARIAYYSRSLDGLHWVTEQGEAYLPGCSVHEDGTVEEWYKYERAKVYIDETGRAAQINFAVIDTIKNEDKAQDIHSSKNITMPLNRGLLLEVLNTEPIGASTAQIRVLVKAEEGFDPLTQLDTESLVFGNFNKVNYGEGARVVASEPQGRDLVLTFAGESGIDATEFAPKMIGRDTKGRMVYGYARLPYVNYRPAIVSALRPTGDGKRLTGVVVENFGLSASEPMTLRVTDDKGTLLAKGSLGAIEPYGRTDVSLEPVADIPDGATGYTVTFYGADGAKGDDNKFDIVATRAKL